MQSNLGELLKNATRKRPVLLGALVVLLTVALIGAFSESVSPIIKHQRRNACISNLRQIDGAVYAISLEKGYSRGHVILESEVALYVGRGENPIPRCPSGGRYAMPIVGAHPVCSYHGDILVGAGYYK